MGHSSPGLALPYSGPGAKPQRLVRARQGLWGGGISGGGSAGDAKPTEVQPLLCGAIRAPSGPHPVQTLQLLGG